MSAGAVTGWAYLDAFVGRRRELELLRDLCARRERLVTVVGPGGIGKTRLVEELLRAQGESGGPPVVACDLTGVRDADGIRRLVALALDTAGPLDASSIAAIGGALRARGDVRLFVDNCEHVVDAAAELARALLDAAPRLCILAASRERLHLRGEHVLELGPLDVPERIEDTEGSEAFTLLIDRLRRARVGYAVEATERQVFYDLVRSLDGVPLAIELAAPRVAALGSAAVLERMNRRFDLLKGGARDLAGHQRALRDSIAWSWDLLSLPQKSCLAQCSVFRGGFTIAAAEAVVRLASEGAASPMVDLLEVLRDKSLVFARAVPALSGEHRFGLLDSLREFAAHELDPRAAAEASLRHARHYAFELEALSFALEAGEPHALARLDVEKENLRVLVDRALSPPEGASPEVSAELADLALRALGAVDLARLPIPWSRLAADLDHALAAAPPGDSPVRARALLRRAGVRWRIGPLSRAELEFDETIQMARRVGDRRIEGRAIAGSAMVLGQRRAGEGTLRALEEALSIHREVGDRRSEASTLLRLGLQRGERGEVDAAEGHYGDALVVVRAIGDRRLEGQTLSAMGILWVERGDYPRALEHLEAASALGGGPMVDCGLGMASHAAGALDAAVGAFARGLAAADERGDRYADGLNRGFGALAAYESGDVAGARVALERTHARFDELDYGRYAAFFLAHLATIEAMPGNIAASKDRLEKARQKLELEADPFHVAIDLQAACIAIVGDALDADPAASWAEARSRILPAQGGHRIVELELSLRVADFKVREFARTPVVFEGLTVHAQGHWFRWPTEPEVPCRDRAVLARLLARLAQGRTQCPGAVVTADALIAAAWPGEKMSHAAAKNRLKVHVAKLRSSGLRAVLLSSEGGYFLDPAVPVRVVG